MPPTDTLDSRSDKTTIGLSQAARDIAERIRDIEEFQDLRDVAIVGLAYAVNSGAGVGASRDTVTTWNVGTFDPSGQLRDLVLALYPEVEIPYRQIEFLVNSGLEMLASQYRGAESTSSLIDILSKIT